MTDLNTLTPVQLAERILWDAAGRCAECGDPLDPEQGPLRVWEDDDDVDCCGPCIVGHHGEHFPRGESERIGERIGERYEAWRSESLAEIIKEGNLVERVAAINARTYAEEESYWQSQEAQEATP